MQASSSADGSIRVWNIKEKRVVNIWTNVMPKCNSFFTAKTYGVPSFHPKDGRYLAYPNVKDVIIVERSSWKELFRLKCINIKTVRFFNLNILLNNVYSIMLLFSF